MKRLSKISLIILCALILSFASITANAADTTVAVASTAFQTHQGETFTTTIYIPDDANIVDFDITLNYDTDLIKLESIAENEDVKGTVVFNAETDGIIKLNYTRTSVNVTKYLPIVDLTFSVDENIGVGVYDCFTVNKTKSYVAHRLNDAGTLDSVEFNCDFSELIIYEMGDVDLSCKVDVGDATYIRRHLAEIENATLSDFKLTLADTYSDGIVDIADAVCLQRHLADLDVIYGNRINITFYDNTGAKYITKSVLYNGTLSNIPDVPNAEGLTGGVWSQSPSEYIEPNYSNLTEDISLYVYYNPDEQTTEAIEYYKKYLINKYYSGDLPTNMCRDQDLVDTINYQSGYYASLVYSSSSNYILNQTTGQFTKPTYPQDLSMDIRIISYNPNGAIEGESSITFDYKIPGMFVTPTKAEIEEWINGYFTDDTDNQKRVNFDVKLISSLNNEVIPVEGGRYDDYEVRLDWYQKVDGTLVPIDTIKRGTTSQINDYVAVASFNGKPLEGDGKIYVENVEVTAIEEIEIKNHIITQIAANMGTLATDGRELWNNDTVYGATVTWETGKPDVAYVANNVIQLEDTAISGSVLPLNARVSYKTEEGSNEFVLSYNLTVSSNNTLIKAPENMDVNLYKAIKEQLEETMGYRGDLTSAALSNVKFVNLDLSDYGVGAYDIGDDGEIIDREITSLRGLSYCTNLRTLNISNLQITDGTMNQIATLSYLEAFIARNCNLDNLSDGGTATLKNALDLRVVDLTNNNFTSLDSVFAEGSKYGQLREVYLSNNKLKDINALKRAPIVEYLSLANNGLTTEGTACIADYPILSYLNLSDNNIDSVEYICNLKSLRELRLHNNNLSNVNDLRKLIYLEALYLGNNNITEVGFLNTLSRLEIFYVNDNKITDVSALKDLKNLKSFNINNNDVASLSVLSNYKTTLTEIYAENNRLTDFSFINGAVNLRFLMLSGNKLELAQKNMSTWLSALPEMKVLTLSDIKLNDLSFLSSMEKITRLDVANCGLSAYSGENSNIELIADKYATLRILDISNNDMSGNEDELLKLRDVTLLTVLYADNICDALDINTLTYSMAELKFISLENCGITSASWLSKYDKLVYVDLAGNDIAKMDLDAYLSNASQKTLKELYLDTNVECEFNSAFYMTDFNVERLSLEGISINKMENMPYLPNIKYLNIANTGLESLVGDIPELADNYSIERYNTVETIDVSGIEADISVLENINSIKTVYAVDTPDGNLFYKNNLHALQRLYNKGVTCYLYDKNTKYVPTATKEGMDILNLIEDFSCDITVAADNVISDNNPFIVDKINGYDITWTLGNSDNYEIVNNHLSVKDYTKLEDEKLVFTAEITVYPDQEPVTRKFVINTHILRATPEYFSIDSTGYSEQLTRDSVFSYDVVLKEMATPGFKNPVKPVEDNISYTYSAVDGTGSPINYLTVITEGQNHSYTIKSAAGLNAKLTIDICATHIAKNGSTVEDSDHIIVPVTVASRTYNVTFVMNGGTITDKNGASREKISLVEDSLIFNGLSYSRPGYVFDGWYTDASFNNKFCEDASTVIMPSKDLTLFAKWNALEYKVIFNANGGSVTTTSKTALSDVALGSLPTPTRTYYTFNGWYTAASGGTKVTADSKFARTTDLTLYAQWTLNSFVVSFNANGGSTSTTSLRGYCGQQLGTLPTPTRDYYNFLGWYTATSGGTKVTSSTTYSVANDITLYAQWELKPVSGWVQVSAMPSGSQVVNRKYSYTQRTYKETRNTSESGWTQYESYWVKSATNSFNYASFPSGYDTGNTYYTSFHKSCDVSAYENTTAKRTVSTSWAGYVYWHWMYNTNNASGTSTRAIYNKKGTGPDNGYYYQYFGAFTSTNGNYSSSKTYCNSQNITNYIVPERTSYSQCQGATRWFRFDYYLCTYTDYYKMFKYYKDTNLESSTYPSGSNISNIVEWVQYRNK